MKKVIIGLAAAAACLAWPVMAQDTVQSDCHMCEGVYVPAEEMNAYRAKATTEKLIDQQVRDLDIGKVHVAVGVEHRGKFDAPGPHSVGEHDHVSEVYHIIDGTATLVLGPDLVSPHQRPADEETVRLFNGPGHDADSIRNGKTYHLKPGDVVFIPAGTGHWFTHIDDHIDYMMVRIDQANVTPLKDEAQSRAYLGSYLK